MTDFVAPGTHLLLDFWQCKALDDKDEIRQTLLKAAELCGATVLDINLHHFGHEAGITGVALLAESHISIHTWPEISYVALDLFMCGQCDPRKAVDYLQEVFEPQKVKISEHARG